MLRKPEATRVATRDQAVLMPLSLRADIRSLEDFQASCGSPMQIVTAGLRYLSHHFSQSKALAEMAKALGSTDECLLVSFDQIRGMTPAEPLQEYRLNKLFAALTDHPRQGLSRAIRACGLGETREGVTLFERTFGIDMPLFLLTCRRAADDRVFRRRHPDPDALVLPN